MKLSYDLIVIDLETTSSKDETGLQQNNYITEIGAVYIDKNTLDIKGQFQQLVKPEETITPEIELLTHITNDMVKDAPLFPDALKKFEEWVISVNQKKITNVRLCAWGVYFDSPVFRKLCRSYNVPYKFSGTWYDVKTMAMMWLSLSGKKTDKSSVEHLCRLMDIKPDGEYHRALVDAVCEAKILQRIFTDLSGGIFMKIQDNQPYKYVKMIY